MSVGAFHSPLSAALRLIALLIWVLGLCPLLFLMRALGRPQAVMAVGQWVYRGLVWILGCRVEVIGRPARQKPVLFVANHCSYFDIIVLGSLLDANFVAKQEISGWPLIGTLARAAGTVFVKRRARHSRTQRDELSARISGQGDSLILFPEGTSSNGLTVLPFKSSLFSVAEGLSGSESLAVQPISVAYTRLDGMPLGRNWRSHFTWYGGMDLASHAWVAFGLGRVTITVIFHPIETLANWGSRKKLSDQCYRVVKHGVISANRGRLEAYRSS